MYVCMYAERHTTTDSARPPARRLPQEWAPHHNMEKLCKNHQAILVFTYK